MGLDLDNHFDASRNSNAIFYKFKVSNEPPEKKKTKHSRPETYTYTVLDVWILLVSNLFKKIYDRCYFLQLFFNLRTWILFDMLKHCYGNLVRYRWIVATCKRMKRYLFDTSDTVKKRASMAELIH